MDPSALAGMMGPGGQGGMPSAEQMQKMQEQQEQQKEKREELLHKVLHPDAYERIKRIGLVNADKADKLRNMVLHHAGNTALKAQITDSQLKSMLESIGGAEGDAKPKIQFQVRGSVDSDDSDIDLSDL